ncbi:MULTISPECIES: hypothetical protein [unclassified Vibrio]|uniref:hypothetical protein n=1 Tax=unclassified Vibrio TaxID=2614977 RepID=UPI001361415D|nr:MULTISPECIES: hypothetical protein [unclassified Vibrio]NAW56829.1 hypothetical protein [Vibrio sp. V36_P2S2PM302]NAX25847.1 hypothetical protein [Vibrio sp. V38_P2S17PM301]NAX32200.1 hypothetical protein [Vibrio sp. V37_P2S8PM304]
MKIIKKDFVDENTESYCKKGQKLSSGTAYYMQAQNGTIYFGGKQCAETHGSNDLKDVPDLTKSLVSLRTNTTSSGGGGGKATEEQKKSLAIAYLLLREELLHDFTIDDQPLSFYTLTAYYTSYCNTGDLSDSEVNHILNIEKYSIKNIDKRLSLKNLSTCHAYKFILDRTEAHLAKKGNADGVRFVNSLRGFLKSNCYLTEGRVNGLSKWIQFLPADLRNAKLRDFD